MEAFPLQQGGRGVDMQPEELQNRPRSGSRNDKTYLIQPTDVFVLERTAKQN